MFKPEPLERKEIWPPVHQVIYPILHEILSLQNRMLSYKYETSRRRKILCFKEINLSAMLWNLCNRNHILAVVCRWNQTLSSQVQCSGIQNLTSTKDKTKAKTKFSEYMQLCTQYLKFLVMYQILEGIKGKKFLVSCIRAWPLWKYAIITWEINL